MIEFLRSVAMRIHGTLLENLEAAVSSAERLVEKPVHRETLQHWEHLLVLAETQKVNSRVAHVPLINEKIDKLRSHLERRGVKVSKR